MTGTTTYGPGPGAAEAGATSVAAAVHAHFGGQRTAAYSAPRHTMTSGRRDFESDPPDSRQKDTTDKFPGACCTNTEPRGAIHLTRWSAPNVDATLQLKSFIQNKLATNRDNNSISSTTKSQKIRNPKYCRHSRRLLCASKYIESVSATGTYFMDIFCSASIW